MSEDQKRDPEAARHHEEAEGEAPEGEGPPEEGPPETPRHDHIRLPPAVDDDAIAKHRAAKEARIRKRLEEKREAAELRENREQRRRETGRGGPKTGPGSALPALRPEFKADTPALRAERVEAIRRDLVRRRRRKGGGMLLKLWLFVALPTALVAWFLWFKASDLYASESKFLVQSAESSGGQVGGLLGGLLGGGGAYDPNAVQTYLYSRDVLRLLDSEHAWIAHFQQPELDYLHRIESDASFEAAYSHFQDMIEVSFDPTEGIIEMSIVAADPESAQRFNAAVIGYAEEMVNRLSDRIQADAVRDAELNLVNSEERLRRAQETVAELQKHLDTFSVEGEVSAELGIIAGMEVELEALKGRLTNLRRVTSEADPRVERIRNQVETLEAQIADRREGITGDGTADEASLTEINLALTKARFEVEASTASFAAAVERREIAVANARRQGRYLEMVSSPSMPDEANYPEKPQLTALAFLGFLGFYIIGSLTISLIREQASI